jgi:hypothetical protein
MEILNHEWRREHLYYIRTEDGIVKFKQWPDQIELSNILYPAFFAKKRTNVIILKNRQRGTGRPPPSFCGAFWARICRMRNTGRRRDPALSNRSGESCDRLLGLTARLA